MRAQTDRRFKPRPRDIFYEEQSYYIAVLSPVLRGFHRFFPSLPWYFFRINLAGTNRKIRDLSSGMEDYQFESPDKLWKCGQGKKEKHFFILHEKCHLKSGFGQGTWPSSSPLWVPAVKVCSVFGLSSFLVWPERKCERAARSLLSEKLLSVNNSLQKVGFSEFWLTVSLTSVHPMSWNIIQTWNHLKIFQLLLLKASQRATVTEDLGLGKSEWHCYTTESQLPFPYGTLLFE